MNFNRRCGCSCCHNSNCFPEPPPIPEIDESPDLDQSPDHGHKPDFPCFPDFPRTINSGFKDFTCILNVQSTACTGFIPTATAKNITVFVHNLGNSDIEATIRNSPDGIVFVESLNTITVPPGETKLLTPEIFSKYTNICCNRLNAAGFRPDNRVKIWFQMQTNDFREGL